MLYKVLALCCLWYAVIPPFVVPTLPSQIKGKTNSMKKSKVPEIVSQILPHTFEDTFYANPNLLFSEFISQYFRDWHQIVVLFSGTNTTIRSFFIKENEQMIDSRYCERGRCGYVFSQFQLIYRFRIRLPNWWSTPSPFDLVPFRSGNYSFQIPISKFVPTNMRVTVQMKWVTRTCFLLSPLCFPLQ